MGIDWQHYHRAVLEKLSDNPISFDEIQEQTCLRAGTLTSIIGGLMARRCVYSTKGETGYFEITPLGEKYLDALINGDD